MKKIVFLVIVFVALVLNGCDEPPTGTVTYAQFGFQSERSPYQLDGTVVDALNNPVSDADIHFMFTLSTIGLQKTQELVKATPSTSISFSTEIEGHVLLRIFRFGTRELITTLVDTTLQAGTYRSTFDAGSLTNGIYVYQLISPKYSAEKMMILMNSDLSSLLATQPFTRTNGKGQFRIPQSVFGLDEKFTVTSETSPEGIAKAKVDSVGIIINKKGKPVHTEWIKINKFAHMKRTFKLQ